MSSSIKSSASAAVMAASATATHSSSSSWFATVVLASAGLAACGALVLATLQTDACSRRLLSPKELQVKRQNEYIYRWSQALQRAKLQMIYYIAGCGRTKKMTLSKYKTGDELAHTSLVTKPEEMIELCNAIVSGKILLRVGRIGKDTNVSSEYFVWLIRASSGESDDGYTAYQTPLGPFCLLLADAMERKITGVTFCFVADASAGMASQLVVDLTMQATKGDQSGTAVATIEEPLWMACMAAVLELGVLSSTTAERVVFALCRLEAATLTSESSNATTVMVTLPGQATTPALLPLLQTVFPDDRHVFCYTGCVRTLEHTHHMRQCRNLKSSQRGYIPESLDDLLTLSNNPVIHTTTILPSTRGSKAGSSKEAATAAACRRSPLVRSTHVMAPFLSCLATLSIDHAETVETWMTSVDAFLTMKENEKTNGYLPYVLNLEYLLPTGGAAMEIKEGSDCYWSLVSLLQFVTGSKSRAMASEQIDAASSWLRERQEEEHASSLKSSPVGIATRKQVEEVVFQHKRILIENKTLLDTVQPKQHWTLKAAQKQGCACCAPEDEEEEEEDEANAGNTTMGNNTRGKPSSSPFAMVLKNGSSRATATETVKPRAGGARNGYVDGKMGFAFDPTRFNT